MMVTAWLSSYMCECVYLNRRGVFVIDKHLVVHGILIMGIANKVFIVQCVSCEFDNNFSVFCLSSFVLGEAVLNVPKRHGRPPFWKIPSRICETLVERRGVRLLQYKVKRNLNNNLPALLLLNVFAFQYSTVTLPDVVCDRLFFFCLCVVFYIRLCGSWRCCCCCKFLCVYERQIVGSLCCLSAVCLVREHDDKARKRKSNRFETFSQYCKVLVEQFHVFIHGMLQFLSCVHCECMGVESAWNGWHGNWFEKKKFFCGIKYNEKGVSILFFYLGWKVSN